MRRLLPLLLVAACRRGGPTYAEVAPILERSCVRCHGGLPPSLSTYEGAARAASLIRLATQRREMPPFGADATGLCGEWADAPWLSSDEIGALAAWAERGAPPGKPAPRAAPPPEPPAALVLDPGDAYTPSLGAGASRCVAVGAAPADLFAGGVRVVADPPAAVRQARVYARACREELVASWSWNTPSPSVAAAGVRVARGEPLFLELRYNLLAVGPGAAVRARAEILAATREARFLRFATAPRLPAGLRQTEVRAELTVDKPLLLHGIVPRMGTLGRVLHLARGSECLAYFGHWDLYDEQLFRRRAPVRLERGDQLTLGCAHDTSSRDEEVTDEECVALLLVEDL